MPEPGFKLALTDLWAGAHKGHSVANSVPMQRTIIHIHAEAPPKPAVGQPCNGCGVCCLAEPCPVGMLVSRKRQGACTALLWDEGQNRYLCGVATEPARFMAPRWLARLAGRFALRWIAAGQGCDCDLEADQPS